MEKMRLRYAAMLLLLTVSAAPGATLTEDFEANFPAWETGWFGANSNAQNVYGIGAGRGNNPDGLWIQDNSGGDNNIRIAFGNGFALSLTALSLDVAGYSNGTRLEFFDAGGAVLSDVLIAITSGAFSDPGVYANYSVTSTTGIGGFRFYNTSVEGNTSIDNVVATTGQSAVPEPATWMLLGTMLPLLGVGAWRRNRRQR